MIGGVPGIMFGIASVITWLVAPPVFAFVIAQAGLAALATPPYSLSVVAAELALFGVIFTDPVHPWTQQSRATTVICVGFLTGGLWIGRSRPVWSLAVGVLAVFAVLLYAGHRYELLTTRQLET